MTTTKQNQGQPFNDSDRISVEIDIQSLGIFDNDDEPTDADSIAFDTKGSRDRDHDDDDEIIDFGQPELLSCDGSGIVLSPADKAVENSNLFTDKHVLPCEEVHQVGITNRIVGNVCDDDDEPPVAQKVSCKGAAFEDPPPRSHGLRYNSEVENESITFNFKKPEALPPKLELLRNGGNVSMIAFSGSHSLRSDASTASTRSFAFPVLQSEWKHSPVRMRGGGDGNFRKHKGWRTTFLCCRRF